MSEASEVSWLLEALSREWGVTIEELRLDLVDQGILRSGPPAVEWRYVALDARDEPSGWEAGLPPATGGKVETRIRPIPPPSEVMGDKAAASMVEMLRPLEAALERIVELTETDGDGQWVSNDGEFHDRIPLIHETARAVLPTPSPSPRERVKAVTTSSAGTLDTAPFENRCEHGCFYEDGHWHSGANCPPCPVHSSCPTCGKGWKRGSDWTPTRAGSDCLDHWHIPVLPDPAGGRCTCGRTSGLAGKTKRRPMPDPDCPVHSPGQMEGQRDTFTFGEGVRFASEEKLRADLSEVRGRVAQLQRALNGVAAILDEKFPDLDLSADPDAEHPDKCCPDKCCPTCGAKGPSFTGCLDAYHSCNGRVDAQRPEAYLEGGTE